MWVLLLITLGQFEIQRIEVLETWYDKNHCARRLKEARQVGLPVGSSIACVHVDGIGKA